jgi:peroxiredoxin (alkyl hydroperoxide reductase subunit C)
MKKFILFTLLLSLAAIIHAQNDGNTRVPIIGEKAPAFTIQTTNGNLKFPSDFGKSWKILFSHPQDFTPVCSSEILELANMQEDFAKLNTKILVLSVDSLYTHADWKKAMEGINYKGRGPLKINFPLAADRNYTVSRQYGMIHNASSSSKTVRAVFIIDPDNVIQTIMYYPMNVGRNMDEVERTLVALQTVAKNNNNYSTPANWQQGNDVLMHSKPTAAEASNPANGINEVAWFMIFRKL